MNKNEIKRSVGDQATGTPTNQTTTLNNTCCSYKNIRTCTKRQAASILCVSRSTVQDLIDSGILKTIQQGEFFKIPYSEVMKRYCITMKCKKGRC